MIYKVTKAEIIKSPKGHEFFSLKLNNSITAKKIFPFRSKSKYDELYNLYLKNKGIDFIVGKYIYANIEKNQYGYVFDRIDCFDIVGEFENLVSSYKSPFSFYKEFYELLKKGNREIETDGTLRLKYPNDHLGINKDGICFQIDHEDIISSFIEKIKTYNSPFRMEMKFNIYNILREKKYGSHKNDIISLPSPYSDYEVNKYGLCYLKCENLYGFVDENNIIVIYNTIYKNKQHPNPDKIDSYSLKKFSIEYSSTNTKRYSSKITSRHNSTVLKIGDLISKEHYELALK